MIVSEVGHISKFCPKDKGKVKQSDELPPSAPPPSATMSGIIIDFLYDPGSQYTMTTKEIYDKLHFRPPLITNVENSGIRVDGHKFSLLCVAY